MEHIRYYEHKANSQVINTISPGYLIQKVFRVVNLASAFEFYVNTPLKTEVNKDRIKY